ncbi:MAG: flavin reductase family protein [Pyrinomonadaceae bacterium]
MPVANQEFRRALSCFASGVTVVTTRDRAGKPFGITISAFSSLSLDPPLILICVEKTTVSHRALTEAERFVVNILEETQLHVSERFASPADPKFLSDELAGEEGALPMLPNALAYLECSITNVYEGGDHSIFVGEVLRTIVNGGNPLIYFHGTYRELKN